MTSDLATIVGRVARGLGSAALAGGLAVGAVWFWDVSGGAPPSVLARGVVVVASILAASLALSFGFSTVLVVGATCYIAAWGTSLTIAASARR